MEWGVVVGVMWVNSWQGWGWGVGWAVFWMRANWDSIEGVLCFIGESFQW